MTAPARRLPRLTVRRVAALAGLLAALHATAYAFITPPWALEDEQQHVDYSLALAEGRLPRLDDPLDGRVLVSNTATNRRGHYGTPPPPTGPPSTWTFEFRAYESYHPPGGYVAGAVAAKALGGRALATMAAFRATSVVLVGVAVGAAALLAAAWHPADPRRAAGVAGLVLASLPIVADVGSRASNDPLALAAGTVAVLLAARLRIRPRVGWEVAALVATLAVAALAKVTAVGIVGALVLAVPPLVRLGSRGRMAAVAAVAAPAAVVVGWAAVTSARYGTVDGSRAFLAAFGPPKPRVGALDALGGSLETALVPYRYGGWHLTGVVVVVLVALVVAGLAARRLQVPDGRVVVAVAGLCTAVAAALVVRAARQGLVEPSGRLVLPALVLVVAAAAGGWARVRPWWAAAVPVAAATMFGLAFGRIYLEHYSRLVA